MGHLMQPILPQRRKWRDVIAELRVGGDLEQIAAASAHASETALRHAADDPQFHQAISFLIQLPLAARSPGFAANLAALDVRISDQPDLFELSAAVMAALDAKAARATNRTDLPLPRRASAEARRFHAAPPRPSSAGSPGGSGPAVPDARAPRA